MRRWIVLITLLVVACVGLFAGSNFQGMIILKTITLETANFSTLPQLSTDGYAKPKIEVGRFAVQLVYGCRSLALLMDDSQTKSIAMGIEAVRNFRPNAHDIMGDVMDTFNMTLLMVKIEKVENGTYYADMLIRQGNRLLQLDSRPSDAIAVAVRADADIYAKESLFERYGVYVC